MTADSISYISKGKTLIHNTSLSCPQGTITALIGPTCSGKSVLLKLLAGRLHPRSGKILATVPPGKQLSSFYPPEKIYQDQTMSLEEFIRSNTVPPSAENRRRVEQLSEKLKLSNFLSAPIAELPDTIIRLSLLISVFSVPASIYALDNPEAGLDPEGRIALIDTLIFLSTGDNVPVILSTNDINFALAASSRYIAVYGGKTISTGQTSSLSGKLLNNLYGVEGNFQNNILTGKGEFLYYNQV